jgi:D-alanyl-D-alanine endopeptidase (penicillin-binding protein 7)
MFKLKSVVVTVAVIVFLPALSNPFEINALIPSLPVAVNPIPEILSHGIYVANAADNESIIGYNEDQVWPIASLTKVMTALIFFEQNPDLNTIVALDKDDMVGGSSIKVPVGTRFRADDLIHASLMSSANNTTHALYKATSLTLPEFVQKMNEKAAAMGLNKTHFVEPTGLDPNNVSTPQEYAHLMAAALDNDSIKQVMETTIYTMRPVKQRAFIIGNTNRFLKEKNDFTVQGAKTGLLNESGFNLAVKAEKDGHSVVAVVFGNSSWDDSFAAAKKLLSKAFGDQ